jgi:Flp pilus assembly protein TadG
MTVVARRGADGTATVEFVWLTILLLVPFVYILIAVFDTQRAAFGVSTASRAAARAFIQAPDVGTGEQRARIAARIALDDQALPDAAVQITCLPSPADCLTPGSSVRVLIRTTQPLPLTPSALGSQLGGITVDSTHTEPYGSYRSKR